MLIYDRVTIVTRIYIQKQRKTFGAGDSSCFSNEIENEFSKTRECRLLFFYLERIFSISVSKSFRFLSLTLRESFSI